jgi:hypothetical protein
VQCSDGQNHSRLVSVHFGLEKCGPVELALLTSRSSRLSRSRKTLSLASCWTSLRCKSFPVPRSQYVVASPQQTELRNWRQSVATRQSLELRSSSTWAAISFIPKDESQASDRKSCSRGGVVPRRSMESKCSRRNKHMTQESPKHCYVQPSMQVLFRYKRKLAGR